MRKSLVAALSAALFVSACGGGSGSSRLNPLTWFGPHEKKAETLTPKGGYPTATEDNRALVDRVTALKVERMPGGAIVRATGLPPTQGWWDVSLVAENDGEPKDGVLTYQFRLSPPREQTRVSTKASREVTAAAFVTDLTLSKLHRIVVVGANNSLSARR
ncbi:hypothetical protein [Acidimangrovimonas pyrenivorans]|uniref:Lipoprotein n=1 Tax=Acidimangrovimonas pyrenivorans TaxID=2030798 RepID=A0ABV7AJN2_9RHOB